MRQRKHPNARDWFIWELMLLGKMPDGALAAALKVSRKTVVEMRARMGIGRFINHERRSR